MLAGPALKALETELSAATKGTLFRFFSLRHEFPNEWNRLRTGGTNAAMIPIAKDRFSLFVQNFGITVTELQSVLILKGPRPTVTYKATLTRGTDTPINLEWPAQPARYRRGAKANAVTITITARPEDNNWLLQFPAPVTATDLDRIQDILIVARYSVAV